MARKDATTRFSNRVEDYAQYRPGYPELLLDWMAARGLSADAVVADVGAGTGILTALLLSRVGRVIAVEPNDEMRARCDALLDSAPNYDSVGAPGEATGLADASVDAITCAQAFHWLDAGRAVAEFRRVLRPRGPAFLIWNDRDVDGSPVMADYEAMIANWSVDYGAVSYHSRPIAELAGGLYGPGPGAFEAAEFTNRQRLDQAGLAGRYFSSSYAPAPDHPLRPGAEAAVRELFARHARDGTIELSYVTRAFCGTPARAP